MSSPFLGKFVLVGYSQYGLRVGRLEGASDDHATVTLINCRSVFKFSAQPPSAGCQGIDALCVVGPARGSRIGPVIPGLTIIRDVKRVSECSEDARVAFAAAGWAT